MNRVSTYQGGHFPPSQLLQSPPRRRRHRRRFGRRRADEDQRHGNAGGLRVQRAQAQAQGSRLRVGVQAPDDGVEGEAGGGRTGESGNHNVPRPSWTLLRVDGRAHGVLVAPHLFLGGLRWDGGGRRRRGHDFDEERQDTTNPVVEKVV